MQDLEAPTAVRPLHVFLSYAREDSAAMEIMERHLYSLVRQHLITLFIDKDLRAGDVWDARLSAELERADVVVFLLSAWLIRSDYAMDIEFEYVQRHYKLFERPLPVPLLIDDVAEHNEFSQWQILARRDNRLLAAKHWGPEEQRPYIQVVDQIGELAERHRQQSTASAQGSPTRVNLMDDALHGSPTATESGRARTKWRWENQPTGRLCARKDLVKKIKARLDGEPGVPVVLTGHGGMGKSTAAHLYADQNADKYDYIAKIPAESPETLAEAWRALAEWLGLPASDVPSAGYALRAWLAEEARWLLVLDNAYGVEVLERLPVAPMGDVLVTTRERFTGPAGFRLVTVAELDEAEAEDLLLEAAGAGADAAAIREICAAHSYDPLALEKALLDLRSGMPPRRYLARLRAGERSS